MSTKNVNKIIEQNKLFTQCKNYKNGTNIISNISILILPGR